MLSSNEVKKTSKREGSMSTQKTTEGNVELRKPQIREFPFQTRVFERCSRVEKSICKWR